MKMKNSRLFSFVRTANRRSKNMRALRRAGIWAYSSIVRASVFLPPPRVLLNGPAKSGTHLLSDCLSLMPKMMFSGKHFALADFVTYPNNPWDAQFYLSTPRPALDKRGLKSFLSGCPQGMFITMHAKFHPDLWGLVEELQFKHILLLRDPRDIVVSRTFFEMRETWLHHHSYYTKTLKNDEERILATICGFDSGTATDRPRASIRESFEGYMAYLDDPSTLVCRFEDLVGLRGGGGDDKQLAEIMRIGDFVGRPLSREQAQLIARQMYSPASLTYRKGEIGDWKNHFTETHRRAFKDVAGDILLRLNYEDNSDW